MKKYALGIICYMGVISMNAASEMKPLSLSPDVCISAYRSLMSKSVFSLDIKTTDVSDNEVKLLMRYQNEDNFPEDSVGKCNVVNGNIVIYPPDVTFRYKP